MTHLTIAIDEQILQRAQLKASQQGRPIDELVREYLERFADDDLSDQKRAIAEIDALAERFSVSSGGRRWTREELYER